MSRTASDSGDIDHERTWTDLGVAMGELESSMTNLADATADLDDAFSQLQASIERLNDQQHATAEVLDRTTATLTGDPRAEPADADGTKTSSGGTAVTATSD